MSHGPDPVTALRRMPRHQQIQTYVCVALILLIFGSLAISAVTECMQWFIYTAIFDSIIVVGFAVFAPARWKE
jgi:hypothetical protein